MSHISSPATTPSAVLNLNAAGFDAAVREGITLVDFWAPWCAPCRLQGPVLEALAGQVSDTVRIAKINIEEHPGLATRFRITGIPTLLLFRDGRVVRQFVGLQSLPSLLDAIDEAS